MRKGFLTVLGAVMAITLVSNGVQAAEPEPVKILEQTINRPYQDLTLTVHLVKTSATGRERPMDLVVQIKDDGKVKKTLAEFTGPAEVKGMQSLSWDYHEPGKESERWFKLAGLEFVKCRGKACERMEEQFGFSPEIFAVKLDQADHKFLGEETIEGTACYKIESRLKDPDLREDPVIISWIDKEKFVARRIEAYDKQGKLSQSSTFSRFEPIGEHWWEMEGELIKHKSGKKVSFAITDVKLNQGLSEELFVKPKEFKVEEE